MKLLFDQNISFRVLKKIDKYFPNSKQVKSLGLQNSSDTQIWKFARANNFSIVTFDADFKDIANINGFPPKIIWFRFGNTTTNILAEKLIENKGTILEFLNNPIYKEISCLEIY